MTTTHSKTLGVILLLLLIEIREEDRRLKGFERAEEEEEREFMKKDEENEAGKTPLAKIVTGGKEIPADSTGEKEHNRDISKA